MPPMSFGSKPSIEKRLRKSTPYSSIVCAARVVTRQFAASFSYFPPAWDADRGNTPRTGFVLPTSRTRSRKVIIDRWPVLLFHCTQFAIRLSCGPAETRANQGPPLLLRIRHFLQSVLLCLGSWKIAPRTVAEFRSGHRDWQSSSCIHGRAILAKRRTHPRATIPILSQYAETSHCAAIQPEIQLDSR